MTFVIAQTCNKCANLPDAQCVNVCPVDCIHPRKDEAEYKTAKMLYINPAVCINCGNCEPVCPVDAIFTEGNIPKELKQFVTVNASYYRR